jgi:anti-sigma B factor antagonist
MRFQVEQNFRIGYLDWILVPTVDWRANPRTVTGEGIAMSCTVSVRNSAGVAIVDLSGRFTLADATGVIRRSINGLLEAGEMKILLNLAEVSYLDSAAGIGELVGAYTSALRKGAALKLLRAGPRIDYVLNVVGLHKVFEIYDSEEEAVASFTALPENAAV